MRSIDRAQELGEVFTHKREVDAMLDLIPDSFADLTTRFLEPACGDGNFLVEIYARKIAKIQGMSTSRSVEHVEFEILLALSSIYGVDISELNVGDAIDRLVDIAVAAHAFLGLEPNETFVQAAKAIAKSNIVLGDALNEASDILLVEYRPIEAFRFKRVPFHLEAPDMDLFYIPPEPLHDSHYLELR